MFSGEDGIRTHVPVKANGFQDRLVMTTSIPLHNLSIFASDVVFISARNIISKSIFNVNHFFIK